MKIKNNCSEMQRKFCELEARMHAGDELYDNLVRSREQVDRSLYWSFMTFNGVHNNSLLFYSDPPVGMAEESNRVLIVGTNSEIGTIADCLDETSKYHNSQLSPARNIPGLIKVIDSLKDDRSQITYCSRTWTFWARFFGIEMDDPLNDSFLDNISRLTVPKLVMSTGNIRSSSYGAGETLFGINGRLREIASDWDIQFQPIPSFAR